MILIDLPKDVILRPTWWAVSPPVPKRERPVRRAADGDASRPAGLWVSALEAIGNGAGESASLSYDRWRDVIFAIHHETGGSDDGLALAHAWSSRSPKYSAAFLEERVWPYVKSGAERGGAVITGGTVMSIAAKDWGWVAPLDVGDFPVLQENGRERHGGVGGGAAGGGDVAGVAPRWRGAAGRDRAGGDAGELDADGGAWLDADDAGGRLDARGRGDGVGAGGAAEGLDDGRRAGRGGGLDAAGGRGDGRGEGRSAEVERRGVPEAKHLCTDQANANRLVKAYGSRVLVAAGKWHVWDGVRWRPDEADVYRYACRLSQMVKDEAAEVLRAAKRKMEGGDGSVGGMEKAQALADALGKWSIKCEMKGTIEAAVGLARKMLEVDAAALDADPWLLNCRNGVVDLRTGVLREHRAEDLITKLADVEYRGCGEDVPGSGAWEHVVEEICDEDRVEEAERHVSRFLRRWFGYCATGLVDEQVFVVHWGDGSNGKSTMLGTVARVLGDYAGTAAPGLLASSENADRHPTEIAALRGRRMVTAHETREGVQLREDFVKQATGGDRLVGRYMREDFFEFDPTHKLQLLTNSKPVVKGQNHGIWRRVRLVAYRQCFGSEEDVREGRAMRVGDKTLAATLGCDEGLSGVLAWIVRGAIEWARMGGLSAPAAVMEASEAYRFEQDRVGQFVRECCEVGAELKEPLTMGMGGLYPSYTGWCKEGGFHGLARGRFLQELQRVVPGCRTEEAYGQGESGKRRKVLQVFGLRLLGE